jgi:hypothetical protein
VAVRGLKAGRARPRALAHNLDRHPPRELPKAGPGHIARGFGYAVAFHGFGREGILVGGAASDSLKWEVADAIGRAVAGSGIAVSIARPGDELGGSSPRNIVNRLTAGGTGGIQIEQSSAAREGYWQDIADAVADVYGPKLA